MREPKFMNEISDEYILGVMELNISYAVTPENFSLYQKVKW